MRIFGPGSSGGGAGGAPTGAQYVALATHADLTAERVLTAPAAGITLVDTGANGTVTITLANDLSGLEGLTGTGSAVPMRTAADTWTTMQLTPQPPQGRLTPQSATPVAVTDSVNFTTFYYALYEGDLVPIYDGTSWTSTRFTELSIAMAASSNWAANSNYDVFVINDAGTIRLATGTVWTSGTARSADTIARTNGIWLNSTTHTMRYGASSTVSVTANRGTYVGTIRTTGSAGTSTWELGGAAANGDPGLLYLWNAYNRVPVAVRVSDSTASWTYASATWQSANVSTSNRVTYLVGLSEDPIWVQNFGSVQKGSGASDQGRVGVGLDVTDNGSGVDGFHGSTSTNVNFVTVAGGYIGYPGLGLHFVQAVEISTQGTTTFYGLTSSDQISGLAFLGMA